MYRTVSPQVWFLPVSRKPSAAMRLFCFPYAGGGASIYRGWESLFSPDIEVLPVQLPGRESRGLESPFTDIRALVRTVSEVIGPFLDKPFAFFGHSMGALISYELSLEVMRKYRKEPVHLFVSGKSAPHLPHRGGKQLHALPDTEFMEELRKLNGTQEEILANRELMQFLMPRLRADFALCETYRHQEEQAPLPCPVSVFGGDRDPDVGSDSLNAWKDLTREEVSVRMFEGDHFFLHPHQEAIISDITADARTTLSQVSRQLFMLN